MESSAPPLRRPPAPLRVAPGPLAFFLLALLLSAAPLWDQAPAWTSVLFLGCAGARLLVNWQGLRLPRLSARLVLLAGAIVAILLQYGTFKGIEPGFGILLVLISLKVMEADGPRDLQILTVLGYFLGLCSLFFTQELNHWLYVGFTTALITAARIRLQEAPARGSYRRALGVAGTMFAQALPLMLLLFVFVPRPREEFRFLLGSSHQITSGMSDRLQPGSISSVALHSEVAFHARFPDGNAPPAPQRYWRGLVLWHSEGLAWSVQEHGRPPLVEPPKVRSRAELVRQEITLEPHGAFWLFGLDRPVRGPAFADFTLGGDLRNRQPVTSRLHYEVLSRLIDIETQLSPAQAAAALQVPPQVSPAVRALADSFRTGGGTERDVVQRGLNYLRKGGFTYSIEPGLYRSNELDEFLFQRRVGFCEHYAAAFASLMRLAGIPSRVVAGYLGGEYNEIGDYFRVRQSEAHAWCEVWIAGSGWVRVDPTSVIAPERMSLDLQAFLAGQGAAAPDLGGRLPVGFVWHDLLQKAGMFWDNLSYQWDQRVLTFNDENQHIMLTSLGMGQWQWNHLTIGVVAGALLLLAALTLWLARPTLESDPALRAYARFCRRGAAAGLSRAPGEGPLDFSARLATAFPGQADAISQVGQIFAGLRYGRAAADPALLRQAVRRVGVLRGGRRADSALLPFLPPDVSSLRAISKRLPALILCIVIGGLVVAYAHFPRLGAEREDPIELRVKADLQGIASALRSYRAAYGKYPQLGSHGSIETSSQNAELMAALGKHSKTNPKGLTFLPDAQGTFRDPWNRPYRVRFDDAQKGWVQSPYEDEPREIHTEVIVWSLGPDGVPGSPGKPTHFQGSDDRASWR